MCANLPLLECVVAPLVTPTIILELLSFTVFSLNSILMVETSMMVGTCGLKVAQMEERENETSLSFTQMENSHHSFLSRMPSIFY